MLPQLRADRGTFWKPVCTLAKSDCGSNGRGHDEVSADFTSRCENLNRLTEDDCRSRFLNVAFYPFPG